MAVRAKRVLSGGVPGSLQMCAPKVAQVGGVPGSLQLCAKGNIGGGFAREPATVHQR